MLTDITCKTAPSRDKIYVITDEKGLCLEIYPNGSRYWRLYYRYGGKKKRIALGIYPEISLKEAREKREESRKVIRDGNDPAQIRKKQKIETKENVVNTFENIAREWFKKNKDAMAERHAFYVTRRLETNVFPFLGSIPIKKITPKDLLAVVRKIEERGAEEVARRTLQVVGRVFRYAIATDKMEHDITADLRGALKPAKKKNYSHFSEKEFLEFLKEFADFRGNTLTKLALKLLRVFI
jgi:hypothetical protein